MLPPPARRMDAPRHPAFQLFPDLPLGGAGTVAGAAEDASTDTPSTPNYSIPPTTSPPNSTSHANYPPDATHSPNPSYGQSTTTSPGTTPISRHPPAPPPYRNRLPPRRSPGPAPHEPQPGTLPHPPTRKINTERWQPVSPSTSQTGARPPHPTGGRTPCIQRTVLRARLRLLIIQGILADPE